MTILEGASTWTPTREQQLEQTDGNTVKRTARVDPLVTEAFDLQWDDVRAGERKVLEEHFELHGRGTEFTATPPGEAADVFVYAGGSVRWRMLSPDRYQMTARIRRAMTQDT